MRCTAEGICTVMIVIDITPPKTPELFVDCILGERSVLPASVSREASIIRPWWLQNMLCGVETFAPWVQNMYQPATLRPCLPIVFVNSSGLRAVPS